MWLPFALLSGLVFGIRRIYDKKLTGQYGNFSLSFVQQVFSLLPIPVLFLFFPIPGNLLALPWQFWWPLLVIWFIIYPVQQYYLFRAIREGDLSHVTPVLALVPVFNAATSYLLIHEEVSIVGLTGIFAIVLATFLLLIDTHRDSNSKYNKPVLFMLLACICMAIGSTMDKIAIEASTPVFYSFVNLFGASVLFLALSFFFGQAHELKQVREWKMFRLLFFLGVLNALAFVAGMAAFAYGPTSYSLAIRSGSYIVVALWGLFLLKERLSNKKISALILFAVGTIALAVN